MAKRIVRIVLLVGVAVVASLAAIWFFAQQLLVHHIATFFLSPYGVEIQVDDFALSLYRQTLTAKSITLTNRDQSRISIGGVNLSFSMAHALRGEFVLPSIVIDRIESHDLQGIIAAFSGREAATGSSDPINIVLPFTLGKGEITSAQFSENFGRSGRLEVGDSAWTIATTQKKGLEIRQVLRNIRWIADAQPPLLIGDLTSTDRLEGAQITFNDLSITSGLADLKSTEIHLTPQVAGTVTAKTEMQRLPGAPAGIETGIDAVLTLSGTISDPRIAAVLRSSNGVRFDGAQRFSTVTIEAQYRGSEDGFDLAIPALEARGEAGHISVLEPLVIRNGSLTGDLTVDLSDLKIESTGFSAFSGTAHLAGTIDAPRIDARLQMKDLKTGPVAFGPLEITSRYDPLQNALVVLANEPTNPLGGLSVESLVKLSKPLTQETKINFQRIFNDQAVVMKGSIESSGGFTPDSILGSASIEGEYVRGLTKFPFVVKGNMDQGSIRGSLTQDEIVAGTFELNLDSTKSSSVVFSLKQPQINRWIPEISCGEIALRAALQFPLDDPNRLAGEVDLSQASIGCGELSVKIEGPRMKLQNQKLLIGSLALTTQAGTLTVNGEVSPQALAIEMNGKLDLPFAGHMTSAVSDVSGSATVDLRVTGPPAKPDLRGEIVLSNVAATVNDPFIEISKVIGKVTFTGETVTIPDLQGVANEGSFSLSGELQISDPLATLKSSAAVRNISLHPTQDTEVWLSSDLTLNPKEINGRIVPSIAGVITINDGTLEKQFDQAFIRERIRTWIRSNIVQTPDEKSAAAFPDFNLKVVGDGSFSIKTNIARADLSPALTIAGTPQDLRVGGDVRIASGSFDIGRTHFEIVTGKVLLKGSDLDLELFAQGEAKDENGFPITITLEISGNATDPRVTVTSDNGLTQEEIVKILAAGGALGGQSIFDQAVSVAGLSQIGLLTEDSWLSAIIRVDELDIEPSYELATGRTSSKVHASKQISDEIGLAAQFPFSGVGQSKISATYNVSPLIGIEGSYRPPNVAFQSSAGLDVNWTIVSPYKKWPLEIRGNEEVTSLTLMNGLGVSRRSRISLDRLPVIERKIRRIYIDLGYLDVKVRAECTEGCASAHVEIEEGDQYTIQAVSNEGDLELHGSVIENAESFAGTPATKGALLKVQRSLITNHRKQGYYRSRIVVRYEKVPEAKSVRLSVKGAKRDRYQFTLDGNLSFSFETFAKSLRLNDQSFPFGPRLPGEFITAVEQYYLERGYADLRITSTLTQKDQLIALHLAITEGEKFSIENVEVVGSPLPLSELKKLVAGGDAKTIFDPPVLYRAAVQFGRREIETKLRSVGYPQAVVEAEEIRTKPRGAKVRYTITAGPQQGFVAVVEGIPAGVRAPTLPVPASLETLTREKERLEGEVRRAGYRLATVAVATDPVTSLGRITVDAGVRETISSVTIIGNDQVTTDVIRETLALEAGMPLDLEALAKARTRLLRRGLFAEVSITPDYSTQGVTVSVRERILQNIGVTTGYDSVFGIHLGVNAFDRAFFSDGRELSIRSDLYYDYTESRLSRGFGAIRFRDPDLFDHTAWSEEAGLITVPESSFQEFELTTLYLRSELDYQFSPMTKVRFGHVAELLKTDEVPVDIVLSDLDTGSFFASALTGAIEYVDQDDPIIPRYARKVGVEASLANAAFGSEADYFLVQPSFLLLQPTGLFDDRFSFLLSGGAGIGYPLSGTDELPLAKRFRLGGQDSVRGYRMNSLGPRSAGGSVIGGDHFYHGTAEVRYEVVNRVQLLSFLDLGSVWLDSFGKRRIDFGTGVGVRYSSPVGSIGADVGVPVNPQDGSRAPEFYLRLGAAF